jgi:hypothetical protein
MPGAISTKLGTHIAVCMCKNLMYVCSSITLERLERFQRNLVHILLYVCVCLFKHNSGTPGAISTKLGTHIAICMCKNLMYVCSSIIWNAWSDFDQTWYTLWL